MSGEYADELAMIGQALSETADILIYGCNFGEGELGKDAATLLAELTGGDVAASTDDTGNAEFGGDWELEYTIGEVETAVAVSIEAQVAWEGLLATETVADDFATGDYTGNTGTQNWTGDWVETDAGGDIGVVSQELELDVITANDNIYRQADLSGALTATLSFSYNNTISDVRVLEVQASNNGGGSYTTLSGATFSDVLNTGIGTKTIDITSYIASNTRIRFLITTGGGGPNIITFDDVQIQTNDPVALDDAYTINEDTALNSDTATWFDSDWGFRRTLSFDNLSQTENLTDFPVLIKLDSTRIDYAQTQNLGEDLRFLDSDGTVLDHQIELWDEAGTSYVWVRIPQVDNSSETDFIWMYYGNATASDGQNAAGVWSNSFQAVYHLDEDPGAGGTVVDATGTFDGTNSGSTDATGFIANAQDFSGTSQYVDLGTDQAFLNNTNAATLSAWVNTDITTGSGDILGVSINGTAPEGSSRAAIIRTGDEIRVILRALDSDSSTSITTTTNALAVPGWHHVVGVVDYVGGTVTIYVDGVAQATTGTINFTLGSTSNTNSTNATIGTDEDGGAPYFDGRIDEARIVDTDRSADWIAATYASETDAFVTYGYQQIVAGVLGNDIDVQGNTLTASLVTGPTNAASFNLNADGSFTYTPVADFNGVDTFTYQVSDSNGGIDTGTVTITVNAVPDAPVAADDRPGLTFDGVDDIVQLGSDSSLEMTNTMTMEAWFRPTNFPSSNYGMILNKEGEYEVGIFPDGTIRWGFSNTDPGWSWHDTGHVVTLNEWTHVAVTYDNGTIITYVDGSPVDTYNGSGSIGDSHALLDDLLIGGRSNNPTGKYFEGSIGEVRIWNTVRTGGEISTNYDLLLVGNESGLVGNWRLREGSGTTATDLSSSGNDGTLGGGMAAQEPTWVGYSTDQNTPLNIAASGVLVNDVDPESDPLVVSEVNGSAANVGNPIALGSGALVTLNADGSFTYDPNGQFDSLTIGEQASDQFTYTADDGNGGTDTATVNLIIMVRPLQREGLTPLLWLNCR